MRFSFQFGLCAVVVGCAMSAVQPAALAQSGSMGGSIGKQEKSLSGSQEEAAPPRRAPRREPVERRQAEPRRSGGGGGGYDGAWIVTALGSCEAAGTAAIVVTSGRIIGQGISGTVSGGGAISTVGNIGSIVVYGSGRFSGRTAYGTYRQSNGCTGRFTGVKQ